MHLFLKNLYTAGKAAHLASRAGIEIQVKKSIPVYNTGYWSWTPEACLDFTREAREAVRAVFQELDRETQRAFTSAPGKGERVQRARFWKRHLKETLPPAQYSEAILKMLGWLIRCSKAVAV